MRFPKKLSGYESEFTEFLEQLKRNHPELAEQQQAGLALLWDKAPLDLNRLQRDRASHIKRGAYAYQ